MYYSAFILWFDHFLDSGAEICQMFRWFFGKSVTPKIHSEINWPLVEFLFHKTRTIDWSELTAILESVELCLKKWSVEVSRLGNLTSFSLDLFTSVMSLYASFFNRAGKSRTFEPVTFMKQLESLVSFVLPLIIQSPTFKKILVELKKESFFKQSSMLDGRSRDPENLPSLGAIGKYLKITPIWIDFWV